MDLETLNPDTVEAIFVRHGACSITLTDAGDEPVLEPAPGETPLWPRMRITGLYGLDANLDALRSDLLQSLAITQLPPHQVSELQDRDWEREWLKDFGPMKFGSRLWICPGDSSVDDEHAVIVHLDPGLAFGTGTHPTTAMCLEWLDGLDLQGSRILDYGCGSGVLAIASLLLGSANAVAMDIDPQAVIATRENATRNNVVERLDIFGSADELGGKFDIVVANILAGPIVRLADSIVAQLGHGCKLALSGILSEQTDEVLNAYRLWIEFDEPVFREQGGQIWTRLTGRRIEG